MDSPPDCSALSQPPSDPTPSGGVPRETLDVEDDSARQDRLGNLLSSLSADRPPAAGDLGQAPELKRRLVSLDGGNAASAGRTWHVPEGDALKRARAFLPLLATSNTTLLSRAALDPTSVDIEHLSQTPGEKAVEMELGLGVFDVNGSATGSEGGLGKEGLDTTGGMAGMGPVVFSDSTGLKSGRNGEVDGGEQAQELDGDDAEGGEEVEEVEDEDEDDSENISDSTGTDTDSDTDSSAS